MQQSTIIVGLLNEQQADTWTGTMEHKNQLGTKPRAQLNTAPWVNTGIGVMLIGCYIQEPDLTQNLMS